jgi:hypothetical protein
MLTDSGSYPEGMTPDETIFTYAAEDQILQHVHAVLEDEPRRLEIAARGFEMIHERYSKHSQWVHFQELPL